MLVRFSSGRGYLKTIASVFTLHGHDRAVVQVQHHAAGHCPARLAHEVPSLGEEVKPVPGCGHKARLAGAQRERGRKRGKERENIKGHTRMSGKKMYCSCVSCVTRDMLLASMTHWLEKLRPRFMSPSSFVGNLFLHNSRETDSRK